MISSLRVSHLILAKAAMCIVLTYSLMQVATAQNSPLDDQPVDAIYTNGKVVTVDSEFSIAEAFAVRGDEFVAVGDNASIRKLADTSTKIIDFGQKMVLPGLVDAHVHFPVTPSVSLVGISSVSEIVAVIAAAAAKLPAGEWIVTSSIGDSPDYFNPTESLVEKRWPTLVELDKAAPRHPVYIPAPNVRPNPAIFNTAAFTRMGVSRETQSDDLVIIGKDEKGELTGHIVGFVHYNKSSPLYRSMSSVLPKASPGAVLDGISQGLAAYIRYGVTSIYAGHGYDPVKFRRQVQELISTGQTVPRVVSAFAMPRAPDQLTTVTAVDAWMSEAKRAEAEGAGSGDEMFKILGMTINMDGATQFGASLMHEPYIQPNGHIGNGTAAYTIEQLINIGRLALQHNLRLNLSAAGNKSCEMVVQALEAIHRETSITNKRWVLIHFQHPTREQMVKLKEMGIVVQTYSAVDFTKGAATYKDQFPGKDLWKSAVPLRWWFDAGITVAQSSDGRHRNPAFTIWDSLMRLDGSTGISQLTPEKQITRREAIEMYSINGARVMQWENQIGSIEPGKLADFVVFDRDILTVPMDEIREAKVLLTAMGGTTVYGSLTGENAAESP